MWTSNLRILSRRLLRSARTFVCAHTAVRRELGFPPMLSSACFCTCRGFPQHKFDLRACNFSTESSGAEGPVAIDYSSSLEEKEFHKVADETLNYIQEKVDELGEELEIEGFDIDHAEGVLTVKLGRSGTYVINKQTPNRQIWLSSPVSGPARFDWDGKGHHWVYRRTKAELLRLLENELKELLGPSIQLVR